MHSVTKQGSQLAVPLLDIPRPVSSVASQWSWLLATLESHLCDVMRSKETAGKGWRRGARGLFAHTRHETDSPGNLTGSAIATDDACVAKRGSPPRSATIWTKHVCAAVATGCARSVTAGTTKWAATVADTAAPHGAGQRKLMTRTAAVLCRARAVCAAGYGPQPFAGYG